MNSFFSSPPATASSPAATTAAGLSPLSVVEGRITKEPPPPSSCSGGRRGEPEMERIAADLAPKLLDSTAGETEQRIMEVIRVVPRPPSVMSVVSPVCKEEQHPTEEQPQQQQTGKNEHFLPLSVLPTPRRFPPPDPFNPLLAGLLPVQHQTPTGHQQPSTRGQSSPKHTSGSLRSSGSLGKRKEATSSSFPQDNNRTEAKRPMTRQQQNGSSQKEDLCFTTRLQLRTIANRARKLVEEAPSHCLTEEQLRQRLQRSFGAKLYNLYRELDYPGLLQAYYLKTANGKEGFEEKMVWLLDSDWTSSSALYPSASSPMILSSIPKERPSPPFPTTEAPSPLPLIQSLPLRPAAAPGNAHSSSFYPGWGQQPAWDAIPWMKGESDTQRDGFHPRLEEESGGRMEGASGRRKRQNQRSLSALKVGSVTEDRLGAEVPVFYVSASTSQKLLMLIEEELSRCSELSLCFQKPKLGELRTRDKEPATVCCYLLTILSVSAAISTAPSPPVHNYASSSSFASSSTALGGGREEEKSGQEKKVFLFELAPKNGSSYYPPSPISDLLRRVIARPGVTKAVWTDEDDHLPSGPWQFFLGANPMGVFDIYEVSKHLSAFLSWSCLPGGGAGKRTEEEDRCPSNTVGDLSLNKLLKLFNLPVNNLKEIMAKEMTAILQNESGEKNRRRKWTFMLRSQPMIHCATYDVLHLLELKKKLEEKWKEACRSRFSCSSSHQPSVPPFALPRPLQSGSPPDPSKTGECFTSQEMRDRFLPFGVPLSLCFHCDVDPPSGSVLFLPLYSLLKSSTASGTSSSSSVKADKNELRKEKMEEDKDQRQASEKTLLRKIMSKSAFGTRREAQLEAKKKVRDLPPPLLAGQPQPRQSISASDTVEEEKRRHGIRRPNAGTEEGRPAHRRGAEEGNGRGRESEKKEQEGGEGERRGHQQLVGIYGAALLRDIVSSVGGTQGTAGAKRPSILILGPPGVGKTSLLRDIAYELASTLYGRKVVMVDTWGEFARYDTEVTPSPASGRRVVHQVPVRKREKQFEVMLDAVRTYWPEVLVIDEIAGDDFKETVALQSIVASHGVTLIAGVRGHRNLLLNLLKDPPLAEVVRKGGKGEMTGMILESREEEEDCAKQPERNRPAPIFAVGIEVIRRNCYWIHFDLPMSVNAILSNRGPATSGARMELRYIADAQQTEGSGAGQQVPVPYPASPSFSSSGSLDDLATEYRPLMQAILQPSFWSFQVQTESTKEVEHLFSSVRRVN